MTARVSAVQVRISEVEEAIRAEGFRLTYRRFVEDSKSPGFPGHIAGRTDRVDREIVVSTFATADQYGNPSPILRLRVLKHELHHIQDPGWDCGCRSILDPRPSLNNEPEGLRR